MAKSKDTKSTISISKSPAYDKHKLVMHLDLDRTIKFNKGEQIQVSQEELDAIGLHRWLIIHDKEVYVEKEIKEGEM